MRIPLLSSQRADLIYAGLHALFPGSGMVTKSLHNSQGQFCINFNQIFYSAAKKTVLHLPSQPISRLPSSPAIVKADTELQHL
jgi:hypothetical protein